MTIDQALTSGNWIAFQTPSQKANVTQSPQEHWSVGVEHESGICHGVGKNDEYMLFSGIGTKADAQVMAASKRLLEALEEQIGECFDPLCDMCARHAEIIALAKGESA